MQLLVLESVPTSGLLAQPARPGRGCCCQDGQRRQLEQEGKQRLAWLRFPHAMPGFWHE